MTDMPPPPEANKPVTPFGLLLNSSKLIIAAAAVGALLGFGASQVIKPRWVAKMTVQIGQLAITGQTGIGLRLIENQLTAADRYNLPATRLQVIRAMGLPDPESSAASKLVFDTLRASTDKSPDVISLQVSGYTQSEALTAIASSFKILSAEHNRLFEPSFTRMKTDLDIVKGKLEAAQREYDKSVQSLKSGVNAGGTNAAQNVLVTNLATVINSQILNLKQQSDTLREALEPSHTYPTRTLGEAYVPAQPSTPGTALLIASGFAVGLVVGALIAFQRRSFRP